MTTFYKSSVGSVPGINTLLSSSTSFPKTCIKSSKGSETAPPSTPECKSAKELDT